MTDTGDDVRLDLDRSRRIDLPEAIYCQGKSAEQVERILRSLTSSGADAVIATRITDEQWPGVQALAPDEQSESTAVWRARPPSGVRVAVVSAGTSDLPIANECALTLRALGHQASIITDVGVAGLHRLTSALEEIADNDVIVAIAGMEGALPTVLAGLVAEPIVAVPTSAGYGTSFEGITALISMMSSCAPGIAVVGIDNGYGAACVAHRIAGAIDGATNG